jgi:hypothetical protein
MDPSPALRQMILQAGYECPAYIHIVRRDDLVVCRIAASAFSSAGHE